MPFVTTAVYATSLVDDDMITFHEYKDCESSKKYIRVEYSSNDYYGYRNLFDDKNHMTKQLMQIYNFAKTTSYVNYIEHMHLYAVMGCQLSHKENTRILMVSDRNTIGQIVENIDSDCSSLSSDTIFFYECIYIKYFQQ